MDIKLSSAFGLSHIYPVGGFVAGSMEATRFYKCFQKDRFIAVDNVPVLWDTLGNHTKEFGCKVFGIYPRKNEEAGIIDDKVEAFFSLIMAPSDEVVSGKDFPCCCTKAK